MTSLSPIAMHAEEGKDRADRGVVKEEDLIPLVPTRPKHSHQDKEDAQSPPSAQDKDRLVSLPTPDQAVQLALQDVLSLPQVLRAYQRYLWTGSTKEEDFKAATISLNMVSRAPIPLRCVPLQKGLLLRFDMRSYAPREKDTREWLKLWEEMRFDPAFNLLLTRDELAFAREKLGVDYSKGEHVVTPTSSTPATFEPVDVVRIQGTHIDPVSYHRLQVETYSQAPVVSARYFSWRALSTFKGSGVYKVLWGGLYYEFRGIRKAKGLKGAEKATDLDVFLDSLGVGNIRAGLTADKLFDRLRSDQRTAQFRSGVTGKPRRVDWFHGPDSRDGTGVISITHDLRDEDVDIGTHPVFNLLHFQEAAFEVIAEGTNGFHLYSIYDGKQNLIDVAAQNVVSDRTVPNPFSPTLQCAISCIACHETQGDDGWKPVTNDVKKILGKRLDVFGDLSNSPYKAYGLSSDDASRLAGLYSGNFDKSIRRARDDYAETFLRCSGPWKESKDQVDIVKIAATRLVNTTRGYWYDSVTPDMALRELGIEAPKGKAAQVLSTLLPPDFGGDTNLYVAESPVIGALKEGTSVNRSDWDLAYGFAAARARHTLAHMKPLPLEQK